MVSTFGISSSSTTATSAASNSAATLANNFDDFLTLLTTQLQHQDPTSPMDSNQFTQQLVSFAGVEQQISTNKNLETLNSLMKLNNVSNSVGYLGNDALIDSPYGDTDGASGISWKYSNNSVADSVSLEVQDSQGDVVYSEDGETTAGLHDFKWNGQLADGTMAPAGEYSLVVKATDSNGDAVDTAVAVRETITAVDTSVPGTPVYRVGPNSVTQSQIYQLIYGQ